MTAAFCALLSPALRSAELQGPAAERSTDSELARRLVEAGRILPLEQLLRRAQQLRPGELVAVELEYEATQGGYLYEIELLDAEGRVWEVELDAATGRLIELEAEEPGD